MSKSIILTGGGTAGHVMPNLALLPYLKSSFDNIYYIGSENGVEKEIIAAYPYIKYYSIPCIKLIRSLSFKNLAIPFKLAGSVNKAKKIIKEIEPSIIFSKGGYVALPVVLGAGKVPVICHESDISMGLANKLSSKKCKYICTSFWDTCKKLKNGIHTGAPIRTELYEGKKLHVTLNENLPTVLIMGGSLGAKAINDIIFKHLERFTAKYNVLHITGKANTPKTEDLYSGGGKGIYHQIEFTDRINDYYATADLVVSRGGANSIFELVALKKPSLIIPLPKGSSRGDQIENAKYFSELGYCYTLSQEESNVKSILEKLEALQTDSALIKRLYKARNIDGTQRIAKLILDNCL